jgi:hypothetical protein
VSKTPVSSAPSTAVLKLYVLYFCIRNVTILQSTFHTAFRKFQYCPLLSLTVCVCNKKRAHLTLMNEDIHRSSAQEEQANLGRQNESIDLYLHFLFKSL